MADTTYKRLDKDELIFLVQYLFTKLKNSSLAKDTTYTLEKSGANVILKDSSGATVSTLENVGKTYSEVTSEASGLMTPTMLETLNNLKSFSEGGIATVKVNGSALTITNNTVDVTVPTKTSDLTNDSQFVTSTDLTTAINNATHLKKEIVTTLPAVTNAKENVIYMVLAENATSTDNIYNEYMLINGAFEKIGDTNLDLSGYVKASQMQTLTNTEITKIVDDAYSTVFTS